MRAMQQVTTTQKRTLLLLLRAKLLLHLRRIEPLLYHSMTHGGVRLTVQPTSAASSPQTTHWTWQHGCCPRPRVLRWATNRHHHQRHRHTLRQHRLLALDFLQF
jgi:hypothetical protein